jgi:hypothetical protein
MTIYGLFNMKMHPKIYGIGKRLKMRKNEKSIFHLLFLFEQGSPIGLL